MNIMKTSKYIIAVALAGVLAGCGNSDIPYYDSEANAVRFSSLATDGYSDGTLYQNYSFAANPLDEYATVDLPLVLVGNTADHDRTVSVSVDTENSTAEEGSYAIEECVIPADTIYGHVRLKLYNVTGDSTYVLKLKLNASDELKLGPSSYLTASVSWNNSLPAPPNNNVRRTYNMLIKGIASPTSTSTAYYSTNALKVIVAALGWDDWDDPDAHPEYSNFSSYFKSAGYYKYLPNYRLLLIDGAYTSYSAKIGEYIDQYNSTHDTPLLHDAGQLMGQPIESRYH